MIPLILFILGLFLGSFLGVLADRLPLNKDVIRGRSYCDFCKKSLKWYDLIPLFSYILLSGKCRYCKKSLPLFYPATEITTGIIFVLLYFCLEFLALTPLLYYFFISSVLITIFFSDLKHGIIPDIVIILGIIASLLYFALFDSLSFLPHLLSGLGAFIFFMLISLVYFFLTKKHPLGGGDIKLSFLLGLILGFPGIIVSLYLAFLTGALASIILILCGKKSFLKDSVPFGPFLVLSSLISLIYGNLIFSYFLKLLGI